MIGKKIAKLRKVKGWTRADLAKETGLSKSYIGAIEGEVAQPSIKAASIIAECLGVKLENLLEDK